MTFIATSRRSRRPARRPSSSTSARTTTTSIRRRPTRQSASGLGRYCRFTSTVSSPTWRRSARSVGAPGCRSSRTRVRRTAPSARVAGPGRAERWPRSASTRRRTSARWATRAPSLRRPSALARHVRSLRQHGEVEKYRSENPGYTARLDTIQGSVLLRKLPHSAGWNAQRAAAAERYQRRARGRRRPDAASGPAGQLARVAPLRGPDGRASPARGVPRRARDLDCPPLSRAASPLGRVCRPRSGSRCVPGCGGACRRGAFAPDLPRDRRVAARARLRGGARVLRAWLSPRRNEAPHRAARRTSCSARASSSSLHEPVRLPDRRRHPDRTVRRDPARRRDRRALQDPEPHVRLRGRR